MFIITLSNCTCVLGAHLNPAVTIAQAAIGKFSWKKVTNNQFQKFTKFLYSIMGLLEYVIIKGKKGQMAGCTVIIT